MSAGTDWIPSVQPQASSSITEGWKSRLLPGKRGGVLGNVANALTALRYAPEWQGILHFNESSFAIVAKRLPPFEHARRVPFDWADEHDVETAAWLQHQGISVNKEIAGQAVQTVAREHSFHPIRYYLDSLKWDGIKRIDDWLTLHLGADPSDYVRAVGAKFLISGVARVYQPGCKVDTCLILEGPQGVLKSTAFRVLAGDEFFSDDIAELGSKDSVMQTRGVWIIELSELDSMAKSEVSRTKAFMSRQVDRVRLPYGRRVTEARRECIFAGTTNKQTYLKDETGGRRFWPVKAGVIHLEELRRDRDQLWAEARERFLAKDSWWLDKKALVDAAADEAQARYESDPWDQKIALWISTKETVSVAELLALLEKKPETWTQTDETRVARALQAKGWTRYRASADEHGERPWRYKRGPSLRGLSQ
jgi:predicted P-loop ATPase